MSNKHYSFEKWCIDNGREDLLERWDYTLNVKRPSEVSFKSNEKYWFKCPSKRHESELSDIQYISSGRCLDIHCRKCDSFAQYIIDSYGQEYFEKIWDIIHSGALSETMVRQHECIQKNCKYFEKKLENKYWARKESINAAKKRDKLLKWYADKSGTGIKKTTGKLLKVSSSTINTDLESMLQFFKELEIYHIYLFYHKGNMKMEYTGGFYGLEVAIEKAKEYACDDKVEYTVIIKESCLAIGYRVLEKNRNLAEIDLSWCDLYKAIRKLAEEDVLLRMIGTEEVI